MRITPSPINCPIELLHAVHFPCERQQDGFQKSLAVQNPCRGLQHLPTLKGMKSLQLFWPYTLRLIEVLITLFHIAKCADQLICTYVKPLPRGRHQPSVLMLSLAKYPRNALLHAGDACPPSNRSCVRRPP